MPRGRSKAKKEAAVSNGLFSAVQFVGSVLKDQGSIQETHILLSNNYVVAFNGVLAAGIKATHDLYAAPNYVLLEKALSRCSDNYSIEQQNGTNNTSNTFNENLIIKSGKFKAIVPCIDPSLLSIGNIDNSTSLINEEFKKGLEAVLPLPNENAENIYAISILINGQSVVGCQNGVVILEYWHGNEMPTGIAIPKSLAIVLTKTTKKLKGFGCSDTTFTFYFEDDSWIRSQLFKEKWPDIGRILNVPANTFEVPKDLYEGLASVAPHSVDGLCYFDNGVIRSSVNENFGASFEVKGLPKGPIFNIKQLMLVKDYMKHADFFCEQGKLTYFQGGKCRGVIAGTQNV